MEPISNRYDFVVIFDVTDGNPNGDPDAGNAPRLDPETGQGLVSDVCLKRKIRNYITLKKTDPKTGAPQPGYDIYVKEKAVLNDQHRRAYDAKGLDPKASGKEKAGRVSEARAWMCQNFFDIRMFGAVMSTEVNCGQVRGPVQLTFSRSLEPIAGLEQALTRMAVTTEKEAEKQGGDNRTMGRKEIVPYGLYVGHGFVNPFMAADTGFTPDDLDLLWEALGNMFELDRSAARGLMAARRLVVFRHGSALGNAPAHKLFERVKVSRATSPERPARSFADYQVAVDTEGLPAGVTVEEKI